MNKRLPTFSSWDRVARCQLSALLPQVHSLRPHAARDRGHALHRVREVAAVVGVDRAIDEAPDSLKSDARALLQDAPPAAGGRAEVAYAIDIDTGHAREIGQSVGRRYGELAPTEIAGTVDCVRVHDLAPDHIGVEVEDLKTGWSWVPHPSENWQVRLGALAASRVEVADCASVSIIRPSGDGYRKQTHEMDELELDLFLLEVQRLAASLIGHRVRGDKPDPVEGPWCQYCPAWDSCPAKRELLSAMVSSDAPIPEVNADTVRRVWDMLQKIPDAIKRAQEALEDYVRRHGPVELADGMELAEYVKEGQRKLDPEVVATILPDAVETVTHRRVTQRGIQDTLRAAGASPLAPAMREIMDAIADAGGVERSQRLTVGARKKRD